MLKKLAMIAALVVLAGTISTWRPAQALAACRDDCYADCCGGDSLCQDDDEVSCLTSCLKECEGDSVPAVPEPTPADDDGEDEDN